MSPLVLLCFIGVAVATNEYGITSGDVPSFYKKSLGVSTLRGLDYQQPQTYKSYPFYPWERMSSQYPIQRYQNSQVYKSDYQSYYPYETKYAVQDYPVYEKQFYPEVYRETPYVYPVQQYNYEYPVYKYESPMYQRNYYGKQTTYNKYPFGYTYPRI